MQMTEYDTRQPWEDLANGIIIRACDDYIHALDTLKKPKPDDQKKRMRWAKEQDDAVREIRMLNRFFRNDWYSFLTAVDPEYIIQGLIQEHGNTEIITKVNRTIFDKERI